MLLLSFVLLAASVVARLQVAPLLSSTDAQEISDSYIVSLKKDITADQFRQHQSFVFTSLLDVANTTSTSKLTHFYFSEAMKGYAGKFQPSQIEEIRKIPLVDFVEKDQMVYATTIQEDAPWGLSRISNQEYPGREDMSTYDYPSSAGEGVYVYVVDTGIHVGHSDFDGRAIWGVTIPDGDEDTDNNGHGTHCAGIIAGKKYGVAKKAKVVAVKVLRSNGSGSMSDVIKGVEFVYTQHTERVSAAKGEDKKRVKSVANMSLGGGRSRALDGAVNAVVDAGIVFAVAAGNEASNACNFSPASAKKAITVGASTIDDRNAWFSNNGECVDVFAPGKDITSTWIGSSVATNTISGTSMASPHVAGLCALVLGQADLSAQQVKDFVISTSTKDALQFLFVPRSTPNRLIYTGAVSDMTKELQSRLFFQP